MIVIGILCIVLAILSFIAHILCIENVIKDDYEALFMWLFMMFSGAAIGCLMVAFE